MTHKLKKCDSVITEVTTTLFILLHHNRCIISLDSPKTGFLLALEERIFR
jgi:hypothetical protein